MSEAFRLPPAFYADPSSSALAQMLNYGYLVSDPSVYWDHHKLRYITVATLLAFGLAARLLAFLLLLRANANALGRDTPVAALSAALKRRLGRSAPKTRRPRRWRFGERPGPGPTAPDAPDAPSSTCC